MSIVSLLYIWILVESFFKKSEYSVKVRSYFFFSITSVSSVGWFSVGVVGEFPFFTSTLYLSTSPLFILDNAVSFAPTTSPLADAPTVIIVEKAGVSSVLKVKSFIKPADEPLYPNNWNTAISVEMSA